MERIWNYGGRAYAFDITEANCLTRMTAALTALEREWERSSRKWENGAALADMSRRVSEHCAAVRRFFDALFGEGEGALLTGGCDSAMDCDEAYLRFLSFVKAQIDVFGRVMAEVEQSYSDRLERIAAGSERTAEHGDPQ